MDGEKKEGRGGGLGREEGRERLVLMKKIKKSKKERERKKKKEEK